MDNQSYIIIEIIAITAIILIVAWYLGRTSDSYVVEYVTPTNDWPSITEIVGETPGVLAGVWKGDKLLHKIEYGYSDITNFQPTVKHKIFAAKKNCDNNFRAPYIVIFARGITI